MTPVLAVHSGGFTSRQWKKLAELVAPRHRVLTPNLIGYSDGDRIAPGTPFHFRQDVELLAALLVEPTHLVGHSYGGFIAMQLALARPELVRSIALYEPVTFGLLDEPADQPVRDTIGQLGPYTPDASGVDEAWLEGFIDWWQGPGAWRQLPEPTKQAFREVGWKVSEEVRTLAADRTSSAAYATVHAPTLLLAGERTQPAELHVIRKLAQVLPHARLEVLAEMGHMGPITHAARVNEAIAAHISAVG